MAINASRDAKNSLVHTICDSHQTVGNENKQTLHSRMLDANTWNSWRWIFQTQSSYRISTGAKTCSLAMVYIQIEYRLNKQFCRLFFFSSLQDTRKHSYLFLLSYHTNICCCCDFFGDVQREGEAKIILKLRLYAGI